MDAHVDRTATGGVSGVCPQVGAWRAATLPVSTGMQHLVSTAAVEADGGTASARASFVDPRE